MANKYDAGALAANAQHLEGLARTARSNMLARTTDQATRLGVDGERLARQARAADAQRVDADKLAATELTNAAGYDAKAQRLEQQAAAAEARHDYAGASEARELREDAAKAREGASVARARSQAATEDARRLTDEATELRRQEQAIDVQLADMGGRLPATELAVDTLEWHAEKARAMADTVRQSDDLRSQAAAATARGDHAAAAELSRRSSMLGDDADVLAGVRSRPPYVLDHAALSAVGVEVTAGDLSVPLPELIDPNALMGDPFADASSGAGHGDVAAVDPLGISGDLDAEVAMADTSAQETPADSTGGDVTEFEAPSEDWPTPSFGDETFADASLGDPSFADSSFAAPDLVEEPLATFGSEDGGFGELT